MKNNIDGFIVKKKKRNLNNHKIEVSDGYSGGFSGNRIESNNQDGIVNLDRTQLPPVVGGDSSFLNPQDLPDMSSSSRVRPKKNKLTKKKIFLAVLLLLIIPSIYFGYRYTKALNNIGGGSIANILVPTKLKGEDQGRVNILVSGTSEDDPGHEGAELTDSIMIISINTVDNSALMLSIPRDLWVNYGTSSKLGSAGKINEAYFRGKEGETNDKLATDKGMKNLAEVVSKVTGLEIPYYLKIDYQAFRESVDAVGGVDIDIDSGDPYCVGGGGVYDVYTGIKLSKGVQHLSGEQALNLSRSRNAGGGCGMAGSDFSRADYQRQILVEIRKKALSAGTLSNPKKIADLLDSAGDNINHNFQANEIVRLYEVGKSVNDSSIASEGLSTSNVLIDYSAPNGSKALSVQGGAANYSKISQFVRRLTSNDPIVKEQPSVVVLNGTNIPGLAAKKADNLESLGVEVVDTANAPSKNYQNNQIIILNKDKQQSLTSIKEKISPVDDADEATVDSYKSKYNVDFVIIVGSNDQQAKEN
jgi:LCP family protein required for cell wall assembly